MSACAKASSSTIVICSTYVEQITIVLEEAFAQADMTFDDIDAIAVTEGPGLVGALLIGVNAAKALSFAPRS